MQAASAPPEPPQKQLCDAACTEQLEASTEMVTLPSGLQYRDIVVGKGPKPQVGYQVGQGKTLFPVVGLGRLNKCVLLHACTTCEDRDSAGIALRS